MAIIQFKDVWEMYKIKFILDKKVSWENFWALKGIDFEVEPGEILGIIGENGAGKSTLLKLMAGMLKPDRGEVKVYGRVSGLLELGAGFQTELTGRENIYLSAGLFGLTQREIDEKFQEISDFASLGKFIHAPVKCYSQGMFVRLAFAIAIHINPDILLIDDTLAVGDQFFQRRCIQKIFEIKEQGKTIVFVTHDMHMLRRLCKRALFLKEGRIVKDDMVDKVVPLSSQMIGERQGVAALEQKPMDIVFNNGRLFINWKNKLLTPNSGVHAVFRVANQWHSSLEAEWEVKREGENKLVATGIFHRLGLTQIWTMELQEYYTVKWDIQMAPQEPLEIQEGFMNVMLGPGYGRWFSTLERGEFLPFGEREKNWQPMLKDNIFRKCVGAMPKEASSAENPVFAFEQLNSSNQTHAQILNTDSLLGSRVLQYKVLGASRAAAAANSFLYFSGRIMLDIQDINSYLTSLEEEFVLNNGKLRIIFDNGQGIIVYNGTDLTKARHIGASLYTGGKWYLSHLANWDVRKEGNDKLIAKGRWPNLPVVQVWRITAQNESSFSIAVDLHLEREMEIDQQRVEFMASEEYGLWSSDYGKGSFLQLFSQDKTDMLQRCIPDGWIGISSQNVRYPSLSLKFSKNGNNFGKIFNSDFYSKTRILQVEKIEPEAGKKFLRGPIPSFQLEVNLESLPWAGTANGPDEVLQKGELKLIFDKGRGRIYWGAAELTKTLGLYTSLRSKGRWHDSVSSALWKIKEKEDGLIRAVGQWLHLPLEQHWEMRLKEKNAIEFSVMLIVHEEIEVDRLQTNLMLLEKYSFWTADKEEGRFPDFKDDIGDDWDRIYSAKASHSISVSSGEGRNSLPHIAFVLGDANPDWQLYIVNSDVCHRGRILQYLNQTEAKLSPGEYHYFTGRIALEP